MVVKTNSSKVFHKSISSENGWEAVFKLDGINTE